MRCVMVREIGSFGIEDVDTPRPGSGEVLIEVSVTGLCRTDLKIIRVGHRDLLLPRIPGEEVVGKIVELGPGTSEFAAGDNVYVYPGVWCQTCPPCKMDAQNLCDTMRIMGFHRDGGFAEYVVAPIQSLIRVPTSLGSDHAVFAEPLSCCLNALEISRVGKVDTLGVWGGGPAGILLARAARALGAEVVVIEPDLRRRQLAGGYEAAPHGVDVAIVAVGSPQAYAEAANVLNPRGRLVSFSGLSTEGDAAVRVGLNQLHYLEQTVVGAYGCCYRHGVQALDMLAAGTVKVGDMISHRLPLWELNEGLRIVAEREGMKVLLYPGQAAGGQGRA